jgi:hypothetical protein
MKKTFCKAFMVCGLISAIGLTSSSAMAQASGSVFTVNESAVPGANPGTFSADKISGNYTEIISFSGNSFFLSMIWHAGTYVTASGTTPQPSQLGGGLSPNQYGLYVLYTASGTFSTINGVTTLTYTAGAGTFNTYLDPLSDSTFVAPGDGTTPWTITGGSGDDIQIGIGFPSSGQATIDPTVSTCTTGLSCGSFGTATSFSLTTPGAQYFVAPVPFYGTSLQSGQLSSFSPTGTQTINGTMDFAFGQVTTPPPILLPNGKEKNPKKVK